MNETSLIEFVKQHSAEACESMRQENDRLIVKLNGERVDNVLLRKTITQLEQQLAAVQLDQNRMNKLEKIAQFDPIDPRMAELKFRWLIFVMPLRNAIDATTIA